MNRQDYRNMFENITVSDKALSEAVLKAEQMQRGKPHGRIGRFKVFALSAAILTASVMTVYAESRNVLVDFYQRFFHADTRKFSQAQLDYLESYGVQPGIKFEKNGVTMSLDGMIGDKDYLLMRYTVSTAGQRDEATLNAFLSPALYIGKMTKGIHPAGFNSQTDTGDNIPGQLTRSVLYLLPGDREAGETATFVMEERGAYEAVGIDLAAVRERFGWTPFDTTGDILGIGDGNLGITLDHTTGGSIVLESMGFVDGTLVLAVDSSEYYKDPVISLRDKKTGEVLGRCDGVEGVSIAKGGHRDIFPFKIESADRLKDLEIVMPREYHFRFPLTYPDTAVKIDLGQNGPLKLNGLVIDNIRLSPLSLNLDGTCSGQGTAIVMERFYIRFKDGTTQSMQKNGCYSRYEDNGRFEAGAAFEQPIALDSVEAIGVKEVGAEGVDFRDIVIPVKGIR